MPTYRIVFRNGEKRCLVVEAMSIKPPEKGVYRLLADDAQRRTIAVIPADQVLYIVEDQEAGAD
ncbi:MAG: hypothetical protein F4160_13140 [Rhodospirillaceae bacterium]|nr:hypothetical protein [Rhodospirillaceae bacterium]MYH37727.1 hypothetical protein [Rhodospirillaceae bacterium]